MRVDVSRERHSHHSAKSVKPILEIFQKLVKVTDDAAQRSSKASEHD